MAVYERTWRRWEGTTTPLARRFLVITRFALADAFSSRLFAIFYAACALPTLIGLVLVYLAHNAAMLQQLGVPGDFVAALTRLFFQKLFVWQAVPAFFVALIVSPSLVAPDLTHNGLPLYLSRPITRTDYVLGKAAVLALLLSPITWIGGLVVFALQASLEGGGWWHANARLALAHLAGHLTWIVVITLLSLAVSAWVRYKPLARGVLLGIFFVLGAVGHMVNLMTGSSSGDALDLVQAIVTVVAHLFDPAVHTPMPIWLAWGSLAGASLLSLALLRRRLRGAEVVR
jgi:ABC-2 type transport system permease protein